MERCVFCGKSANDVERLIAGPPGIYICNECIELCYSIITEDATSQTRKHNRFSSPSEIPSPRKIYDSWPQQAFADARRQVDEAAHVRTRRLTDLLGGGKSP